MKILYLTSCQSKSSFIKFLENWKTGINTSNQVFHNKLIRTFGLSNDVTVFSIRQYNKNYFSGSLIEGYEKENRIEWKYPEIKSNKFLRFSSLKREFNSLISTNKYDFVVVDCLNYVALLLARQIKDQNILKIGICTDDIFNITNVKKSYAKKVYNLSTKMDAYICLTEELSKEININNKPVKIIEGIVENNTPNNKVNESNPYFFYCGTMLERYGINNLIKAFNLLANPELKLIIAGHHYQENSFLLNANSNKNIKFLGCIPNEEILKYESNALACINPRPESTIDDVSIPSKTLEYLSSGSTTISIINRKLYSIFKDNIIWVNSSDPISLKEAMETVIENKNSLPKGGKEAVNKLYSINVVEKNVMELLKELSR